MKAPTDFLNMSDEEMANFDPSTLDTSVADDALDVVEEVEDTGTDDVADANEAANAQEDLDDAEDTEDTTGDEGVGEAGTEDAGGVEDEDEKAPADEVVEDLAKAKETTDEVPVAAVGTDKAVDYKAEYTRMFKPFKANGKDITVATVDDAISLMQMGANYNKKMAALKPNLQLMKLLENNGLLNEDRLSFLIDLDKKSPEAISKLIKDSGLDPLDLDAVKASEYKPKTYTVDVREIELDTVLDELQSTPTYNRTLDIVSNKWDGPSKQLIAESPQLLKVINDHVARGFYDTITAEVERERMFGRLSGLSDLQAYRQVGDAIEARGGFATAGNPVKQAAAKPVVVVPKPKVDDDKLREKRRAASTTKPAGNSPNVKDFNPLSLSDEDFAKQVKPHYL